MGFYRIGNGLAGKPGAGYFNVTRQQLVNCCCEGLRVDSVDFRDINPVICCNRVQSGTPRGGCRLYAQNIDGALLLAVDHLNQARFISSGNRPCSALCEEDGRLVPCSCGVCEGSVFVYSLTYAKQEGDTFIFKFEVEDCDNAEVVGGIPPKDYECTVIVSKCPKITA